MVHLDLNGKYQRSSPEPRGNLYLSRCKIFQSKNGDFVVWIYFIIIGRIIEGKGQHSLFLQIRFCKHTLLSSSCVKCQNKIMWSVQTKSPLSGGILVYVAGVHKHWIMRNNLSRKFSGFSWPFLRLKISEWKNTVVKQLLGSVPVDGNINEESWWDVTVHKPFQTYYKPMTNAIFPDSKTCPKPRKIFQEKAPFLQQMHFKPCCSRVCAKSIPHTESQTQYLRTDFKLVFQKIYCLSIFQTIYLHCRLAK